MMRSVVFSGLVLLASFGAAYAVDAEAKTSFETGLKLYNAGQKAEGRSWFRKAAAQGSGEGWFWLGYTTTDQNEAAADFEKAAELGYAKAFEYVLDHTLFRAAEGADVVKAKRFFDLGLKLGVKPYFEIYPGEVSATVNACYEAGKPQVSQSERENIEADGRAAEGYTPNDNMKFAEAFANGWGVARDRKKALALVCHASTVPAELMIMTGHLTDREGPPPYKEPFRFCDHITSGEHGGFCASAIEDAKDTWRSAELDTLTASWESPQKAAFGKLRAAAAKYFSEHAGAEQDMSGTARSEFYIEEEGRLKEAFLKSMRAFENGKLPPKSDFAVADNTLNSTYQSILKKTNWNDLGTIKPEGLRATQRIWLKYRDAWGAFGALRYPQRSADDFKAWATRQRIAELKKTFP